MHLGHERKATFVRVSGLYGRRHAVLGIRQPDDTHDMELWKHAWWTMIARFISRWMDTMAEPPPDHPERPGGLVA